MTADLNQLPPERALTVKEAAELAHVSQPVIREWMENNLLRFIFVRGDRRIPRAFLLEDMTKMADLLRQKLHEMETIGG
jgi:excisionase family DNA binding protein